MSCWHSPPPLPLCKNLDGYVGIMMYDPLAKYPSLAKHCHGNSRKIIFFSDILLLKTDNDGFFIAGLDTWRISQTEVVNSKVVGFIHGDPIKLNSKSLKVGVSSISHSAENSAWGSWLHLCLFRTRGQLKGKATCFCHSQASFDKQQRGPFAITRCEICQLYPAFLIQAAFQAHWPCLVGR